MRDSFLASVTGVIHVGANSGQEREEYQSLGLRVVWIEALENAYVELKNNIVGYPDQIAIRALVADKDGDSYTFNVANNEGASSSIYEFGEHRDIWPHVAFVERQVLTSSRLDTIIREQGFQVTDYQALVMDVQGAELLVLRGLGELLTEFRFVKAEAADFESYVGCTKLKELDEFLTRRGFVELKREPFATHPSGGRYWDVVWKNTRTTSSLMTRVRKLLGF